MNRQSTHEVKVGDIVRLNSGSPRMTVLELLRADVANDWHARLSWHGADGVSECVLPLACVTFLQADNNSGSSLPSLNPQTC